MKANLAITLVMAMPAAHGQAPAFEVTSVKFNKLPPRERNIEFGCSPGGRFVSTGLSFRRVFFWAFDMKPFQVAGLPGWIDSADAIFDIEAKAAAPVTEDQCRLMVQKLLAPHTGDSCLRAGGREKWTEDAPGESGRQT